MNDDLPQRLSTIPEPEAPSSITATVMARIEREVAGQQAAAASPVRPRYKGDVVTWVTACLGILLVAGAVAWGWYRSGFPDVVSPRILRTGLGAALAGWPASFVGVVGIALCLRALFAPLRLRR